MFATDHAPHPLAKKAVSYETAANGIIGLETAVGITYRVMVEEEGMEVSDWARAWWEKPRALFTPAFDLSSLPETQVTVGDEYEVDPDTFLSLSRNCPYRGLRLNVRAELMKG